MFLFYFKLSHNEKQNSWESILQEKTQSCCNKSVNYEIKEGKGSNQQQNTFETCSLYMVSYFLKPAGESFRVSYYILSCEIIFV